jgi:hypothetical protein
MDKPAILLLSMIASGIIILNGQISSFHAMKEAPRNIPINYKGLADPASIANLKASGLWLDV